MKHTEDKIKSAIKNLPNLSIDELTHNYKCASSIGSRLYQPFMLAIEKELNSRRKVKLEEEEESCKE